MKDPSEELMPKIKHARKEATAWNTYVIGLRSSLAKTERLFEIFGRVVVCNPWKTILIAVIATMMCGLGLLRMKVETRTSKLFVPQNSVAERALELGKPFFRNSLNSRTEDLLFIPKNGSNILNKKCLDEALYVIQRVVNISGYRDLCKPRPSFLTASSKVYDNNESCDLLNPLEVLYGEARDKEAIFKKFRYASTTPSRLMSNGRSGVFNINYGLAEFRLNSTAREAFAKGIRVLFFLKTIENKTLAAKIIKWEENFIKTMMDTRSKLKCSKLVIAAEKSLDDAISESASSEIPLITVTFVVMFTFSCLMLCKFVNPVRGHTWLALFGVLSTGMGLFAGMGVTMAFGIPFNNLVGVLPFLVVSIGIDDMFIIVDEFDRQSKSEVPSNRVAYALSKVGATISMTTATDCVAFYVSTTSAFPAVRFFCVYAAVCISVEFLLQITLFIAFLSLDSRRISKNRNDCCPMITVPDKTCCRLPNQFSLSTKIMTSYAKTLLTNPAKIIVCLISLSFLGLGIFGCFKIDNEFSRKELALKGSYYMDYLTEFEKTFPQTIPVNLQITKKLNYSSRAVRDEIAKSVTIAYDTGYYMSRNFTWIHYFHDFCHTFNISSDGIHFKQALKIFLSIPSYSQHKMDVILNDKGDVKASRVIVFLKDNSNAMFQKNAMLQLREQLNKQSNIVPSAASDPFIYFEQYAIINREVVNNLIAVSVVILIILIPFCIHPVIIILILFGFLSLILELIGMMFLWNIQLNAISMINLVMSIGFSVDYSAHVAHAFTTSRKRTVDQKIIEALSTVGSSVVLGGTSTFLGMSLTGFSSSNIFQTFFKMFLGIIIFGLFNGLVVLPVLLSLFSKAISLNTNATVQPNFNFMSKIKRLFCYSSDKTAAKKKYANVGDSVSVMGMSARFATARNKDDFWKLLVEGRNTTTEYPDDRYARFQYFEDVYNPTRPLAGKLYVSKGSYLQNIEAFDNKFFGISATEARSMDPQQRMLLQGTFEAIEDAGMKLEELQNCCTGVYVGIMNLDYSSVVLRDDYILSIDQFASTGTAFSLSANRISFALNLNGPSVATDTACSSSLTALSIACDNLQRKVVDVAIVAAANLILCPKKQVTICRANMLSQDGKCKVFDERADGYGRGEGIAVFVLKRTDLVDSLTDDPYCDILGWGVNNDGQAAAPITAPSVEAQHGLMKNVLLQANVDPLEVQYVEMHGTGTIIGDLVETKSVGETYGKPRTPSTPVLIGSVKSNVNHTESTAGLAGLAKVCLMLKNKQIVATVGIENQSARLGINEKGMYVPVSSIDWPAQLPRRIAAVNSFGYGGSNAHLIASEPRSVMVAAKQRQLEQCQMRILVLSARSQPALADTAESFSKWLSSLPDDLENQTDVSFTLSERRTDHGFRVAVSAPTLKLASKFLNDFASDSVKSKTGVCAAKITMQCSRVGFVFGGQGSQWRGMAGDILTNDVMLKILTKIDKIAKRRGHKESLLSYLRENEKSNEDKNDDAEDCLVTVQLSIFALQYAVAQFLVRSASIIPMCVGGHSLGDITAACVAEIITPKEAVKIILARATLQEKCQAKGAMAAVALPTKEISAILEELEVTENVCIAAVNDKNSVTISGDIEAIDRVAEYMERERKDVFWRKLSTQKAFHSHHMESIKVEFMKQIRDAKIRPKANQTAFISSTKGQKLYGSAIDDEYWWCNLRDAVLFNNCGKEMFSEGCRTVIEISPRPVLTYYVKAIAKQIELEDIITVQALPAQKEKNRLEHLYVQCIGKMYTFGYPISIGQIQTHSNGKFIRYPLYSWQESDLWAKDDFRLPSKTLHFLGVPVIVTAKLSQWESQLDLHRFEFLKDHKMKAAGIILPGACSVELALEAALWDTKVDPVVVKNISFLNILPLHERLVRSIKCSKELSDNGLTYDFAIISVTEKEEIQLAAAKLFLFNKKTNEGSLTLAEAMTSSIDQVNHVDDDSESTVESQKDSAVTDTLDSSDQLTDSKESDSKGSDSSSIEDHTVSENDRINLLSDSKESNSLIDEEKSSSDSGLQICVSKGAERLEDRIVLDKISFEYDKELTKSEFKELAAKTGFEFGDTFSLVDHAWSSEKKALTRLKLNKEILSTLHNYIIHPCIIDACLQSCIAIGSTDPDRKVIPIGVETVRLNQITDEIKCLYGYAEVTSEAADSCDVKLLDDNGNIIMYLHGFVVKDVSRAHRSPVFESSIYEMNWIANELDEKKSKIGGLTKSKWLLLSCEQNQHLNAVREALQELEIDPNDINVHEVVRNDLVPDFQEELSAKIKSICSADEELIVVNLLPTGTQSITSEAESFLSAQWLCFESSLETLKALSEADLARCRLVSVTCQVVGYDAFDKKSCNIPWAATPWGMARVTNLETKIPFINFDVRHDACKDEYITAFNSLDDDSIEEGILVSPTAVHRPLFERVNPSQGAITERLASRRLTDEVYLSWSKARSRFCLKSSVKDKGNLPEGYVDVKIDYLSSSTGLALPLLDNIKLAKSEECLQSAVGVVTNIQDARTNLKIGDNVIALFNSKWVKDHVKLPTYQVFRQPEFLSSEKSAALTACLALAYSILNKIISINTGIKSVFIVASASNKGLCWAIAVLARAKGLNVTFNDSIFSGLQTSDTNSITLSRIADKHMKGSQLSKPGFDCVIGPSDLHPMDQEALINSLQRGGVLVVLDASGKPTLNQYNISNCITLLNIRPLVTQLSHQEISKILDEVLLIIKNLDINTYSLPDVDSATISDICKQPETDDTFGRNEVLSCLKLSHDEPNLDLIYPPSMDIQGLKGNRSYIVVGGNRGLGLNTVKWMSSRGAGTIITIGRSDVPHESLGEFKNLEKEYGSKIEMLKADVGTADGITALEDLLKDLPPIAGIVNSAVVLDDKLFKDVNRENYRKVMAPKICGTLLLHNMLEKANQDVDFFVLYSSITSVLGNTGQTTYSAANAFMNSFADYRMKVLGKHCLSICWGAMGGAGILERNTKVASLLEQTGLHLLDIPKGLEWMDVVLTTMPSKSNICICDIDWLKFLRSLPTKKSSSIIYDAIRKELPEMHNSNDGELLQMILQAKSMEKRREILLGFIVKWLSAWIGGAEEEIDQNVPLFTYGIDSVGASALKGQIEKELQIDFEVFYFMQPETTAFQLADDLLKAICDKFINNKTDAKVEEVDEIAEEDDEPLIKEEDEDKLALPADYMAAIYNPMESVAKFFIIHPSHRYSGVFQSMGIGFKFQKLFSLYAFGSPDPGYLGEDIGSVTRLAQACVEMLQEIQPRGPYFLGGYSFGGLVSLEMATILENLGEQVALVVMIDTVRWLPHSRSNTHLLLDMFDTKFATAVHIEEQMKNFFSKIATSQLKMRLEDYQSLASKMSFDELTEELIKKADSLSVKIPDIHKILQSTTTDQAMAARCHDAWAPAKNIYGGHILYIQAEDDKFCQSITGVGSSVDCWLSVLHGMTSVITYPGDHYAIMEPSRAPDIGRAIAVAAAIRFRNHFPLIGRVPVSAGRKAALSFFKGSGMRVCFIRKIAGIKVTDCGKLKVSKREMTLKFKPESKTALKCKIRVNDVMNITELHSFSIKRDWRHKRDNGPVLYAGLCFSTKKNNQYTIMCFNRQDFFKLSNLMQAIYQISLPF